MANAPRIKAMNVRGCERMQLNMLVLQQNLKNIEPDNSTTATTTTTTTTATATSSFVRSATYFALFIAGPDAIVAKAKEDASASSSGGGGGGGGGDAVLPKDKREGEGEGEDQKGRKVVAQSDGNSGEGGGEKGKVKFSHDELKFLIELCYSESLSSDRRDAAVQANRALNEHLLALSEQTWQQQQQQQQ